MHGTSTALVILVPEAEDRFGAFRRAHDSAARNGSRAHITLLFPSIRQKHLKQEVEGQLSALFHHANPFQFRLDRIGRFSRITPHLQLAQDDDEAVLDRLEQEFLARFGTDLPIIAKADAVQLIDEEDGRWHIRRKFPMGGVQI